MGHSFKNIDIFLNVPQKELYMDFGMMLKLGGIWAKFSKNHPKFPNFVKVVQKNGLKADTILDIKITYTDGNVVDSNLKITESDLKLFEELKQLKK